MRAPTRWLGLGLWCALGAAQAFDIPTPQNQPKSVDTTPFGTPQDFAPVTALPEVTALDTTEGAGHLPDGVTVRTEVTVPPEGLLQRAAFLVTLTLIDRTKNIASLTLHRPFGERIAARRISISQRLDAVDGRMANVRVYRFAVTPLSGGEITLNFAEMTFQMVGEPGSHYAFIPVARRLTIRPLPAFWPEYIPVTPALNVVQAPLPPLNAGEPMDWQLRITGQGLTEHALTQLLDEQLIGTEALALGQAQIRPPRLAPAFHQPQCGRSGRDAQCRRAARPNPALAAHRARATHPDHRLLVVAGIAGAGCCVCLVLRLARWVSAPRPPPPAPSRNAAFSAMPNAASRPARPARHYR
ncbi:MAG: hypothetical protein B7X12_09465 [Halothiobacillus sp. 20-53-49]|nr:MAG: hypothetical protein B7X12_09465 [Halothiobacillus sp. 20-53-49]